MESRQHQTKGGFQMRIKETIVSTVKDVNKISKKHGYNKYIKKYSLEKMFMFLLHQQYSGISYGRAFTVYLRQMIGDTTDVISQSELSKKMSHRLPVEAFKEMYKILYHQTRSKKMKKKISRMIRIIDSTALPATPSMDYAKHRSNMNGFKMHTVVDENYLPETIKIKNGRSSDKKSLKWCIKEGYVHIFDRGYNDYKQFHWISDKKAFFVTRALSNIKYTLIRNRKVGRKQKEDGIISDKYIEVIEDRKTGARLRIRMITFEFIDSTDTYHEFSLLTNVMDLRSDEIAQLYRERWNIEVTFRWLKTFLKIKHWLSRSKNGVLIQIYMALCAYLMAVLAKMGNEKKYHIMKDSIYEFIKELEIVLMIFEKGSNIEDIVAESS